MKGSFSSEGRTCIGVKCGERKNKFIKNNITRCVNLTGEQVKTLVSLMKCAISHEDTLFGTELQLMRIVRVETGPAGAPEGTKKIVIGIFLEHSMVRRVTLNDSTR
jgi:hypothetical protein